MGKGKAHQKKAKSSLPSPGPVTETGQHVDLTSSMQAMDGHNVEGWTESQVKAYNELLIEREKLEKQRKELEQRSAVSQAGRALLNQSVFDIDNAFKQQPNGTYKFLRKQKCCVDINSNAKCHHEVCSKSKAEGLNHTEMDTIKYYHMRIFSEKSERIRNALRKQRDLELSKLQKDTDLIKDKNARQLRLNGNANTPGSFDSTALSKATKETQKLVTSILDQLESLRSELQKGQISSSEMQKQLDIIDAEMHAAHLKTSRFKKTGTNQSGPESVSPTGALTYPLAEFAAGGKAETYNKAFHIMENFLSASKPGDFQHAVTELKEVLRLSGPMGEDLQSSFDALEGIFDSPDKLSFAGPDGKQECTSIIDLMEKMKETLQRTGKLPDGANAELTRVFRECIDLETRGKQSLDEAYQKFDLNSSRTGLTQALSEVRASIVSRSPVPPLTEKTLEDQIVAILDKHDVLCLLAKVNEGAGLVAVEGYITSTVMNNAKRDPGKYVESIQQLAVSYNRLRGSDSYPMLDEAFPKVEMKMKSFVAKLAEKQRQELSAPPALVSTPPESVGEVHDVASLLNEFPLNTAEIVSDAIRKMAGHDSESNAHLPLRSLISEHGTSGLWPIWLLFAEETSFAEDHSLQDKSQRFENEVDIIMADRHGGLKNAILYLYGAGACPGLCAAIISEILASISEIDEADTQRYITDLAYCISDLPDIVHVQWRTAFSHLALAMVQLYVALHMNVTFRFPHLHPVDFSLSTVAMVTTYVCLMSSSHLATENLKLICVFLNVCLSSDGVEPVREIIEAAKHYEAFCTNDEYRCLTSKPCSHHFATTNNVGSLDRNLFDDNTKHTPSRPTGALLQRDNKDAIFSRSRFSEHIEDSQAEVVQQAHATSTDHNVREDDTNFSKNVESIETLIQKSKRSALSGSCSNPLAQYTRLIETILKESNTSPSIRDAILRARDEVKQTMKDPKAHFAWTTRRLKFLLSLGGSTAVPGNQALYDLALKDFSMFEEYAALLASGMSNNRRSVGQVKSLCDDICDLLSEGKLNSDSSSVQEFSKIALRDWAKRESGGKGVSNDYTESTAQSQSSHHTDIMSRLQRFCSDLQDLEDTRDKIESLTGQPNARKRQVKVFDDLVSELNQTRGVIMDVASIIAKNRKSSELEGFIAEKSAKTIPLAPSGSTVRTTVSANARRRR